MINNSRLDILVEECGKTYLEYPMGYWSNEDDKLPDEQIQESFSIWDYDGDKELILKLINHAELDTIKIYKTLICSYNGLGDEDSDAFEKFCDDGDFDIEIWWRIS